MFKPRTIISIFLIRCMISAAFFSFVPSQNIAKAEQQEIFTQPFLKQISAEKIFTTKKSPIVIAVLDEGVDFSHPFISQIKWQNSKEILDNSDNDNNGFIDDTFGWNFINNSNNTSPLGGHGTKLAGIIQTVAKTVNFDIQIMPVIICEPENGCSPENISKGIYYAVNSGAKVINLSIGTKYLNPELTQAILYAKSKQVTVVTAAGNNNLNLSDYPISPICNETTPNEIIGVTSSNFFNLPFEWSNFGSCVDLLAPGENIYTSFSPQFENGLNYGYVTGSSYSTAIVSAVVAAWKTYGQPYETIYNKIISSVVKNKNLTSQYGSGSVNLKTLKQLSQQKAISQNKKTGKVAGAYTKKIVKKK